MKRVAILALAPALALSMLGSGVAPASAQATSSDKRPCMSHAENREVKKGVRMSRSFTIIDSRGRSAVTRGGQRQRVFNPCWTNDYDIAIFYSYRQGAWRVLGKAIA